MHTYQKGFCICLDDNIGESVVGDNASSSSSEEEEEIVNGENEEDMDNKGGTISKFTDIRSCCSGLPHTEQQSMHR